MVRVNHGVRGLFGADCARWESGSSDLKKRYQLHSGPQRSIFSRKGTGRRSRVFLGFPTDYSDEESIVPVTLAIWFSR